MHKIRMLPKLYIIITPISGQLLPHHRKIILHLFRQLRMVDFYSFFHGGDRGVIARVEVLEVGGEGGVDLFYLLGEEIVSFIDLEFTQARNHRLHVILYLSNQLTLLQVLQVIKAGFTRLLARVPSKILRRIQMTWLILHHQIHILRMGLFSRFTHSKSIV